MKDSISIESLPLSNLEGRGGAFLIVPISDGEVFCREKFSEEQEMIANSAIEFATDRIKPVSQTLNTTLDEKLTRELFLEMGKLGFLGVDVPIEFGGMELDKTTSCIVVDCLSSCESASFMVTSSAHTGIASLPIIWYGNEAQKKKYLPKMSSGEYIGSFSLTEPGAGSDAMAGTSEAKLNKEGTHYVLNGQKLYVTNGRWADVSVTFAKVDGKYTSFILDKDCKGWVKGAEEKKMGLKGSSTASYFYDNCMVPVENVLGKVGQGAPIAFNVLYPGRYKLGVTTCAGSKYIINKVLDFSFEREQFSRSISNFGMIKNKFANMVVKSWESDTINYMTSGSIDKSISKLDQIDNNYELVQKVIEDHSIESSISKIVGSEALAYIVDEGVQIMGGAGFIEEYSLAGAYRDERINRIFEGTNEINRLVIAGHVLKKSILEELPIGLSCKQRSENWIPDIDIKEEYRFEAKVTEFLRSLLLSTIDLLIKEYGQDLKNKEWVLEPFANMIISFSILDSGFKKCYYLSDSLHKEETKKILSLSIANHYHKILFSAEQIFAYIGNDEVLEVMNKWKGSLNYRPDKISLKQNIIKDLYNHKKYYLD